jgi:hypothetical protein
LPHLTVRLRVFTESFNLIIRPAGSQYLITRASEALQSTGDVVFLAENDEVFLNRGRCLV